MPRAERRKVVLEHGNVGRYAEGPEIRKGWELEQGFKETVDKDISPTCTGMCIFKLEVRTYVKKLKTETQAAGQLVMEKKRKCMVLLNAD